MSTPSKGKDMLKIDSEKMRSLGKAINTAKAAKLKAGVELMKCLKQNCNPSDALTAYLTFVTLGNDRKGDIKNVISLLSKVTYKEHSAMALCSRSKCLTAARTYFEQSKLFLIAGLELLRYLITKFPKNRH